MRVDRLHNTLKRMRDRSSPKHSNISLIIYIIKTSFLPGIRPTGSFSLFGFNSLEYILCLIKQASQVAPSAMQKTFDPCVKKFSWRRKWQFTPIFLPGNPVNREAWWATVHGGHKRAGHDLATKQPPQQIKVAIL